MKKIASIIASLLICVSLFAKKDEIIKTGWNFGPLPVVGFDSDLGFQYGLCCDIFNFGDGSSYPEYKFKINVEASTYTKGSSVLRTYGDFKNVIPKGKLFFDITYFNSPKFGFYGYNGYATTFNPDSMRIDNVPTGNDKPGFYYMSRNQFRALVSARRTIVGNLSAAIGFAYYHITTSSLNLKDYKGQGTLYGDYVSNYLIYPTEKDGGNVTQFRAGLIYDSRNHDSDPTSGLNIEASVEFAPDMIDRKGYNNLGLHLSACQYIPLYHEKLTLAYRALI